MYFIGGRGFKVGDYLGGRKVNINMGKEGEGKRKRVVVEEIDMKWGKVILKKG